MVDISNREYILPLKHFQDWNKLSKWRKGSKVAALDPEDKALIVHIISISKEFDIYLSYRAQIVSQKVDKAPTSILSNCIDFANVFGRLMELKTLKTYIKINLANGL